jgi:hypothetical protein
MTPRAARSESFNSAALYEKHSGFYGHTQLEVKYGANPFAKC